jgi:Na+/phosphate symporter
MPMLLTAVAVLEILGGAGVFAIAESAIHEILGSLAIGFGFLTLGLVVIIDELQKLRRAYLTRNA